MHGQALVPPSEPDPLSVASAVAATRRVGVARSIFTDREGEGGHSELWKRPGRAAARVWQSAVCAMKSRSFAAQQHTMHNLRSGGSTHPDLQTTSGGLQTTEEELVS